MEAATVRTQLEQIFGPEVHVSNASSDVGLVYGFAFEVTPRDSIAHTETVAWQGIVKMTDWVSTHTEFLGYPLRVEIMAVLPLSVRSIKRRIFRVCGSVKQLVEIANSSDRSATAEGSYVIRYEHWAKGILISSQ